MSVYRLACLSAATVVLVCCSSCVTIQYSENLNDYLDELRVLESALNVDPRNAESLRDLGIVYFKTTHYAAAVEYLQQAHSEEPDDPKTLFYLGLAYEFRNDPGSALAAYKHYDQVSVFSPYRRLLRARYLVLNRQVIKEELKVLFQQERELGNPQISETTVAVFPLVFRGGNEKYTVLGKGLSEMMTIDLAQVKSLTVVERTRVDELLSEIRFGQSRVVDQTSAPGVGKILAAGRLIAGSYFVLDDKYLRVDVASMNVVNHQAPVPTSQSDALKNLFKLAKDLVFDILDKMGITLTPAERSRIQHIPTRNFEAFLAYSLGLHREDAGDFVGALAHYERAAKLDPGFSAAKEKAEVLDVVTTIGDQKEEMLVVAQKIEIDANAMDASGSDNLVQERLGNLGTSIGSIFVAGEDSRKPAEEVVISGGAIAPLPEPPRPPVR